jgi:type VI secretion system secreted protein Hcp
MALMAYLMLKGQKQGAIKGGITGKGREGAIGAIAVSHSIVSPRDPQSGLPTGKRMHNALVNTRT